MDIEIEQKLEQEMDIWIIGGLWGLGLASIGPSFFGVLCSGGIAWEHIMYVLCQV